MNYTAQILVKGDDKLLKCVTPEETDFDRSSFNAEKTDEGIMFNVEAKDPVALRATLNTISQLLIVYQGAKDE